MIVFPEVDGLVRRKRLVSRLLSSLSFCFLTITMHK